MREGTRQFWWDEVLPSMGIIRVSGGIPEPTFTSPVSPRKKKKFTNFWRFIWGKQVSPFTPHTVLTVMVQRESKRDHFSIIFRYLVLNSHVRIFEHYFEIHKLSCTPMECDKHFPIPSCINILIWTRNLLAKCNFCKNYYHTTRPSDSDVPKQVYLHSSSRPRPGLQRNHPPICCNTLIGWNVNFVVPSQPNFAL